jgi:hypothetical protein
MLQQSRLRAGTLPLSRGVSRREEGMWRLNLPGLLHREQSGHPANGVLLPGGADLPQPAGSAVRPLLLRRRGLRRRFGELLPDVW